MFINNNDIDILIMDLLIWYIVYKMIIKLHIDFLSKKSNKIIKLYLIIVIEIINISNN